MKQLLHALITLSICSLLLACGGISSEEHLTNAKKYLVQLDYNSAIIELKSGLQQNPNNSEARWLLGKIYFETGKFQGADKELSRAIDSGVPEGTVAPILAQVLLKLGEHKRLSELSDEGLEPESRATIQSAKGLSLLAQGDEIGAYTLLGEAIKNNPVSPYALVAHARLMLFRHQITKARSGIEQAFSIDTDYSPAWGLLGDVESSEGKLYQAETAYIKALELNPSSFTDRLKLAKVRFYLRDFDSATQDILILKRISPEHPGVNLIEGLLYLHDQNLDAAKTSFTMAARFGENFPTAIYYLAAIDWKEGNFFSAGHNITQFLAIVPDDPLGRKLAATLALQDRNFIKAEELLGPVLAENPNDVTAMNLLASALMAQNRNDEGIQLLMRIAELQPDSVQAKTRLGAGFLHIGEESLGLESLQSTLILDPAYQQADILLVMNHLRKQDFDAAIEAAEAYRDRNPGAVTPYNMLGRVYVAINDIDAAEAAFTQSLDLVPGNPGAGFSMAALALQKRNYDSARGYYQQVLQHNPDHLQAMLKLSASYALEGKSQPMVDILERAIKVHPKAVEPRAILAKYYMTQSQPEQVQALFDALTDAQSNRPDILYILAVSQIAQNSNNQALATLERLIDLQPSVGHYHFQKARAYAHLGDAAMTGAELERALELTPTHFLARLAYARLSLITQRSDIFEQQLAKLREVAPDHSDVLQLEIASARSKGDHEYMMYLLETLFEQSSTTISMISLAHQRRLAGDVDGAIALTESWVTDHAGDMTAQEALADLYAKSNQNDKAIMQYSKILEQDENNLAALNNLAWILRDQDSPQALLYAERANKVLPDSSVVLDTLAVVLMKNNELARARRVMDRAMSAAPDSPGIRFHEAQITAAEGNKEGALRRVTSLIESDVQFSERKEAEKLLDQLQ